VRLASSSNFRSRLLCRFCNATASTVSPKRQRRVSPLTSAATDLPNQACPYACFKPAATKNNVCTLGPFEFSVCSLLHSIAEFDIARCWIRRTVARSGAQERRATGVIPPPEVTIDRDRSHMILPDLSVTLISMRQSLSVDLYIPVVLQNGCWSEGAV